MEATMSELALLAALATGFLVGYLLLAGKTRSEDAKESPAPDDADATPASTRVAPRSLVEERAAATTPAAATVAAAVPRAASAPSVPTAPASASGAASAPASAPELPKIGYEEDADVEPTLVGAREQKRPSYSAPTQKIVYDDDAADDEPTHAGELILVTATAQTDKGIRRKRNEDSLLASEDEGIFVVADGMGGYRGGEIASQLAVTTIERAFMTKHFDGPEHDSIPRRASELARAIQMANEAIFEKASGDNQLEGMGTTICAARFSKNKQRVYIGHVGDSRVYLFRDSKLRQMTSDHTMKELGVSGEGAAHLSRAVGVWPVVPIDIVLGKPQPGDVYLLCSDGLSKMVDDESIERVLRESATPAASAEALVKLANERGGKDNVTVIVVRVDDPVRTNRPRAAA
jgi:protein phosphatase